MEQRELDVEKDSESPYFAGDKNYPHILLHQVTELPSCGCRVEGHGIMRSPVVIEFCAMHKAAAELLKALKEGYQATQCLAASDPVNRGYWFARANKMKQVIAKAEIN
jgi:hypothetical protein